MATRTEKTANTFGLVGLVGLPVMAGLVAYMSMKRKAPTSPLLEAYQEDLEEAIIKFEAGDIYARIEVGIDPAHPGWWGRQTPEAVINGGLIDPASGEVTSLSIKDLMIEEAIRLGLITDATEAYFIRAVMYKTDGTTIVPYWWPCPYDNLKFRSPEALIAHLEEVHYNVIHAAGEITDLSLHMNPSPINPYISDGINVSYRNDSPATASCSLILTRTGTSPTTNRTFIAETESQNVSPGENVSLFVPHYENNDRFGIEVVLYGVIEGIEIAFDTIWKVFDITEPE